MGTPLKLEVNYTPEGEKEVVNKEYVDNLDTLVRQYVADELKSICL